MFNLSWDLFVVVLFAIIIAYSFIIGRENTVKIIIGSYIAILTADGLGNLFRQYLLSSEQFVLFLKFFGITNHDKSIILIKVIVFITAIVIIAMKGGFEVSKEGNQRGAVGMIITLILGFLSAGLVLSTLLTYVSGASFVGNNITISNPSLNSAYTDSTMVKMMIDNYNIWFSLPAVCFLILSLFHKKEEA